MADDDLSKEELELVKYENIREGLSSLGAGIAWAGFWLAAGIAVASMFMSGSLTF